jgi:chemotaxis protein methyltransferase CheR
VNCEATRVDLERFRAAIIKRIGLQFDDARLGFLNEVLQRRLSKLGHSSDAYIWDLQRETPNDEIAALARELTVNETYFFRNIEQFHALAGVVLPERLQADRAQRTLRLLSAGCASGEEAYSMAIVAREAIPDPSWEVAIRAVDLNPAVLEKARRARYSSWALREAPADMRQRWFRSEGREMILDEAVRGAVKFEVANLASDDPYLWQPDTYDVIFCRNVLMYFAPEQMQAAIRRITQSLAPGGFLFLGHAETLRGISDDFHLRHTHGTFYYERKGCIQRASRRPPATPIPEMVTVRTPVTVLDDAWFHAIRKASERVAALVPIQPADAARSHASVPVWDVAPAFDLLRKERFDEALDHVRAGPPPAERDADVLLLEATLLTHRGQFAAAEEVCGQLLQVDELNAGAHYVLGLCREQAADREGASEHFRVASYLDPEFAMPRLHQGLLARRGGQREVARRELAQALVLLKREEASRLLLFGGGFKREALIVLCETALRESGGRP